MIWVSKTEEVRRRYERKEEVVCGENQMVRERGVIYDEWKLGEIELVENGGNRIGLD